jgi:hypothetical protein
VYKALNAPPLLLARSAAALSAVGMKLMEIVHVKEIQLECALLFYTWTESKHSFASKRI